MDEKNVAPKDARAFKKAAAAAVPVSAVAPAAAEVVNNAGVKQVNAATTRVRHASVKYAQAAELFFQACKTPASRDRALATVLEASLAADTAVEARRRAELLHELYALRVHDTGAVAVDGKSWLTAVSRWDAAFVEMRTTKAKASAAASSCRPRPVPR